MQCAILSRPMVRRLVAVMAAFGCAAASSARADDPGIVIRVHAVQPVDKSDEGSLNTLLARMTIAGQQVTSTISTLPAIVKQKDTGGFTTLEFISPPSLSVPHGKHTVRLEIINKGLAVDDVIDINPLDNRRHLEFQVDTRTCQIEGFTEGYKCKMPITRSGKERKAAEIRFSIDVLKIGHFTIRETPGAKSDEFQAKEPRPDKPKPDEPRG